MKKDKEPLDANPLFGTFPPALADDLRAINPWWEGRAGQPLPVFHRWLFRRLKHLVREGLTPATVLRGPRRVGKTILLRQIISDLLQEGIDPKRILYVPFDELEILEELQEPILTIARWHEKEVLGTTYNTLAHKGSMAYLFLDEAQNLSHWSPQLKHLVDNHSVKVFVTGSSSFRIEAGRDSLAGRITTVDMGPLLLREIAELRFGERVEPFWGDNSLEGALRPDFWKDAARRGQSQADLRRRSFLAYSERGAYPIAQEQGNKPWPEIADYLNESVIKRAIQHDLRIGARGQKRDEKLLEEVFRLCCRYAGQSVGQNVFVPEVNQALGGPIGWNRILNYLRFLDATLLVRLIEPLEIRNKKQGRSPSKICLCDPGLRAGWLQEVVPLDPDGLTLNPHLSDLAGHLAESALGYFLASIPNLDIAWFPTRTAEPEVDYILTIGTSRIPVEIKYRKRIDSHEDTRGLRAFLEKTAYNAPFGLLVTLEDDVQVLDPRIIPLSLSSFLWLK